MTVKLQKETIIQFSDPDSNGKHHGRVSLPQNSELLHQLLNLPEALS
jgi:hypothetical protein